MKKIVALFLAITVSVFAFAGDSSQSEQIEKLREEIRELNAKYEKQVADDMAILAKLRRENRELKVELRKLKLSMKAEEIKAEAVKSEPKKSSEKKEEKVPEESRKEDSVWDHMFPF